jgi:hypothetical protein
MREKKSVTTVSGFLEALPPDRRREVDVVRTTIQSHLPAGYEEAISKNMLVYQVPLERYSDTYNGHPLWYAAIASEKSYLSLHLMPVYGDKRLLARLEDGFRAAGKRLKMGKACINFTKADELALDVIGDIVKTIPVDRWVQVAESAKRR